MTNTQLEKIQNKFRKYIKNKDLISENNYFILTFKDKINIDYKIKKQKCTYIDFYLYYKFSLSDIKPFKFKEIVISNFILCLMDKNKIDISNFIKIKEQ